MTLKYHETRGGPRPILTECPACGAPLGGDRTRDREDHLAQHDPEDFGLSPLATGDTSQGGPEAE